LIEVAAQSAVGKLIHANIATKPIDDSHVPCEWFLRRCETIDVNGQDNKSYRTKTSTMSHQLHADTRGNMSYPGIWKRTGAMKLTWYRSRLSYSGRRSSSP
jgi:hypothetical protein